MSLRQESVGRLKVRDAACPVHRNNWASATGQLLEYLLKGFGLFRTFTEVWRLQMLLLLLLLLWKL